MQRNMIVFVILAIGLITAWYVYVSSKIPPTDPEKKVVQNDPKKKEEPKKDGKEEVKKKEDEPKKKDDEKKKEPDKQPEIKPGPKVEKPATATLGGAGFHLTLDLTTRGAGVRRVILNRFESADWQGRPKRDQDKKPLPLELVQDDEFAPSFRMDHYVDFGEDARPVLGLSEQIWTFDGKQTGGDKDDHTLFHEAKYSTTVPGLDHLKIVKTYRLTPKDYHATLLIEIYDTRKPGAEPTPIRYQIAGARGLPIEGEFYTPTFRNAFIGMVDPAGSLWRKLEDSARISPRRGGDRFPENRGKNRVQYAGTANQFFAALIITDDKQPRKEDGGGSADDVVAWGRPTLETREKRGVILALGKKNAQHIQFVDNNPVVRLAAELNKKDKTSDARPDHFMKVQEVSLLAGFTYHIEMDSKAFESHVIVEDDKKNKLAEGGAGGVNRSAKLVFTAPRSGDYRIIATTAQPQEIGEYTLIAREQPNDYVLLPRTQQHFTDLNIGEGHQVTLSFYQTPGGQNVASWVRLGNTLKPQFDDITVRVNSEKLEVQPGRKIAHRFLLYHGPIKSALLSQFKGDKAVPDELVDRYTTDLHLRSLTDYPSDNIFGKISSFIHLTDLIVLFTRLMHWLLNHLHNLLSWIPGSYGLSILVLTVMVRGAMFPISRKQALFSIKMQALAPELKKLQEKYPDDPAARMQAQQEIYRKNGVNPLGSCWPIFLQMPIFLGLYFALQESIHFRLAEFLWIDNLAAPDMLLYWSESIPIISVPDHASGFLSALYLGPYLNILPLIAVVFMVIQQIQTMPPPTDDQQAMQHKMLKFMTIFFGIMFYKVAAGLCIYFISSSLWGLCERKLLPKKQLSPSVPPAAEGGGGGASGGGGGGPPNSVPPKGNPPSKWKGKHKKDKNKAEKESEKIPVTAFDKLKALWRDIRKAAEKK